MNFKVGDRVRIVGVKNNLQFADGQTGTIFDLMITYCLVRLDNPRMIEETDIMESFMLKDICVRHDELELLPEDGDFSSIWDELEKLK